MHFYVALNFDVGLYRQHGDKKKILHSSIKVLLCFYSHILYPQRKKISGGFCMGLSSLALIQLGIIIQTIGIGFQKPTSIYLIHFM